MSDQLTVSSLACATALVWLCLAARLGTAVLGTA